ncbi:MAG TPA: bifunctional riboflavin kinase/FAD synthetase [Jiangellaceae bacterium]
MSVWLSPSEVPEALGRTVVTVGVFDGVHRGHQAVIGRADEMARALRVPLVAVTFDPNPIAVLRPDAAPPALTTLPRRIELLTQAGVDYVLVLRFDKERAQQEAADFVDDVLVRSLSAQAVVVGTDFRFGHRAAGDVALLETLGRERDFTVVPVEPVGDEATGRWSSTRIRELVVAGDVAAAAVPLGRPFRVQGTVGRGSNRGKDMGYPTANLPVDEGDLVPADGVYAGWLFRLGKQHPKRMPAAISVGTNPTFGGTQRTVEPHVLDRDDLDLYGAPVAIEFVERLRDQETFDSAEALAAQIGADVERTRAVLTGR